jgi:hypothetical protein
MDRWLVTCTRTIPCPDFKLKSSAVVLRVSVWCKKHGSSRSYLDKHFKCNLSRTHLLVVWASPCLLYTCGEFGMLLMLILRRSNNVCSG